MAVNDDVADRAVAHRIRLEALANNNVRRVNAAVVRAQREILQLVGALAAEGAGAEQIVRAIRQALNRQTPLLRAAIEDELLNLSHYEADATIRMIETALPRNVALDFTTPAPSQLAAVLTNPLAGRTLDEWFGNLTTSFFDRARQAVRVGFLQGETTAKIASELREGFDIDRRNTETIVRTLVASLAQNARQLAFDDNADLFTGLMWRSTLDPRTCPQCAALDGKVFPVDKGPRPPIHPACRCVMTAVLKDASDLGLPPSTRASMNGQVPDTVTYGDWLARQSENIQEEFLGVKRTQLFRDGKLSFDRFINEQGFFYTLPQLKQRESAAWSRAGL